MDPLFVAIQLRSCVGYFIHPWIVILWDLSHIEYVFYF